MVGNKIPTTLVVAAYRIWRPFNAANMVGRLVEGGIPPKHAEAIASVTAESLSGILDRVDNKLIILDNEYDTQQKIILSGIKSEITNKMGDLRNVYDERKIENIILDLKIESGKVIADSKNKMFGVMEKYDLNFAKRLSESEGRTVKLREEFYEVSTEATSMKTDALMYWTSVLFSFRSWMSRGTSDSTS